MDPKDNVEVTAEGRRVYRDPNAAMEQVLAESFDAEVFAMVVAGMPVRSEVYIEGAEWRKAFKWLEGKLNGKAKT